MSQRIPSCSIERVLQFLSRSDAANFLDFIPVKKRKDLLWTLSMHGPVPEPKQAIYFLSASLLSLSFELHGKEATNAAALEQVGWSPITIGALFEMKHSNVFILSRNKKYRYRTLKSVINAFDFHTLLLLINKYKIVPEDSDIKFAAMVGQIQMVKYLFHSKYGSDPYQ